MRGNKFEHKFLLGATGISLITLFCSLFFRKQSFKDWMVVYFYNGLTNGIIDNILGEHKIVKYPVHFFPKTFDTHLLFDYLIYPTFTVVYNQFTVKDRMSSIFLKLFLFITPAFFVELWAERKTNLIDWSKKWHWYHTYFGLIIKSLIARGFIALVRKIDDDELIKFKNNS